jgi:soluble calcium-activated nucleotidase 1
VGKITPERGFSSFKFLPGSRDTVILALKSVEEAATGKQVGAERRGGQKE